jgi:hypothetical protein
MSKFDPSRTAKRRSEMQQKKRGVPVTPSPVAGVPDVTLVNCTAIGNYGGMLIGQGRSIRSVGSVFKGNVVDVDNAGDWESNDDHFD